MAHCANVTPQRRMCRRDLFLNFNNVIDLIMTLRFLKLEGQEGNTHMARPRKSPELEAEQRTYRFNKQLFRQFEDDCARHLSNPKLVLEALILHWLEAKQGVRTAISERHRDRFGVSSGED